MAIYAEIELTNKFQNGETEKLTLGYFDSDAAVLNAVAENVTEFNTNVAATLSDTFVSSSGSPLVGISGAAVTTYSKTAINLNN